MGKIDNMVARALAIANDNSHGYSQANRWGPDYDCSSMMYECAHHAGYNIGRGPDATRYTGTMKRDFMNAGFTAIPFNQVGLGGLKRGDILLNEVHHTEMALGNGQFVGAHSNWDGYQGDSSGREINVAPAYNYPWDYVLRPPAEVAPAPKPKEDDDLKQVVNTGGPVYRLYNPAGWHLLTLSKNEVAQCLKHGWKDEGVAFTAPKGGTRAVYRFYNPGTSDHFYTTDFKEAQKCQKNGWRYEGVPFFGNEIGTCVYRLYNPALRQHHYTTSVKERETCKKNGWNDEGVGWYV